MRALTVYQERILSNMEPPERVRTALIAVVEMSFLPIAHFRLEPWLDTSTLDPDTVRHHPTLRHQCQSTLDRHSARHSDTSV